MRRTAVATSSRRQQKQPANESQPEVEEEEPVQFTAEPAVEDDAEEKDVRPDLDSLRSLSINTDENGEETECCYICAQEIALYALGPCSHRTCHICCVRLRALYKTDLCSFCKEACPTVVFTSSPTLNFEDFTNDMTHFTDAKLGIRFETREDLEDTLALLRFTCPQCKEVCSGWRDLSRHAKEKHDKVLCDLCTRNQKIFAYEHTLFTKASLRQHNDPLALNNTNNRRPNAQPPAQTLNNGFTGHPSCDFCRVLFFDSDALFKHCRDRHEQCFICVRSGRRDEYFLNYDKLEEHFDTVHYSCTKDECREKKFIVFETKVDLQGHMVAEHGVVGDKRGAREARRLDTNFSVGRGGSGQANGSGQNGSVTMPPVGIPGLPQSSSRQQRFGGHLTQPAAPAPQSESITPEMRRRHAELINTVTSLVSSETKVRGFKQAVRSYRNSEMSAQDLVDTLYSLFDRRQNSLLEVVHELKDLLDNKEKGEELASACDVYLLQEDPFPTLAGGPVHAPPVGMKQNKAPAQGRSQHNPAIWARVQQAASSTRSVPGARPNYPALGGPSATKAKQPAFRPAAPTPWAGSAAPTSGRATPLPTSVSKSVPARVMNTKGPSVGDFPSLPTSSDVAASRARARAFFQDGTVTPTSAQWGRELNAAEVNDALEYELDIGPVQNGKKKKKKELLFRNSAF